MAVDLTPLVAIVIAALAVSIIVLILVVVCYCLSRKHLRETRKWSRRPRNGVRPNQPVVNKTKTELVSNKPDQPDVQYDFGPRNVLGGRMYLPSAAPRQATDYDFDAAFTRPQSAYAVQGVSPNPVAGLQPVPRGFTRANFDVGGAYRGQLNMQPQQQRLGPTPVRSRSFEDLLDDDRQHRRRKNKHAKKAKNGQSNGADEARPPPGVALAYIPQLLPPVGRHQPASNVLPVPDQMAVHYAAAAVPQAATSAVHVGAAPPAAEPVGQGQRTAASETTWTRVDEAGNGNFGAGSSGSPAGGSSGGQQAVFAPARSAAYQVGGAQRRYEDQERVVSAANTMRFH